jgi:hypothetical protein
MTKLRQAIQDMKRRAGEEALREKRNVEDKCATYFVASSLSKAEAKDKRSLMRRLLKRISDVANSGDYKDFFGQLKARGDARPYWIKIYDGNWGHDYLLADDKNTRSRGYRSSVYLTLGDELYYSAEAPGRGAGHGMDQGFFEDLLTKRYLQKLLKHVESDAIFDCIIKDTEAQSQWRLA